MRRSFSIAHGEFLIAREKLFGERNSSREWRLDLFLLEKPGMYAVYSSSLIIHCFSINIMLFWVDVEGH